MNTVPPVLYRGSFKNVRGDVSDDHFLFEFSNRYSIFDWGEMPDEITGKGEALNLMGQAFFKYLADKNNWKNLFQESSIKKRFDNEFLETLKNTSSFQKCTEEGLTHHAVLEDELQLNSMMKVKKIHIERPLCTQGQYQYSAYQKNLTHTLVPLEVIFRLGLPEGNSLSKRMATDKDWLPYGYEKNPGLGTLSKPMVDFSTKLEKGDRYIDYSEAQNISGMTSSEFQSLKDLTLLVGIMLYHFHQKIDLDLWDGKIEWAFGENIKGERNFILVDSIGLDEMRLKLNGTSFSKEFLREYYKPTSWFRSLELAKKEVSTKKEFKENFKDYCLNVLNEKPQALDQQTLKKVEAVYLGYANSVCFEVFKKYPFDSEFTIKEYAKRYL